MFGGGGSVRVEGVVFGGGGSVRITNGLARNSKNCNYPPTLGKFIL